MSKNNVNRVTIKKSTDTMLY